MQHHRVLRQSRRRVGQHGLRSRPVRVAASPPAVRVRLKAEREKFLAEHWPRIHATIQRLGLTPEELLAATHTEKER